MLLRLRVLILHVLILTLLVLILVGSYASTYCSFCEYACDDYHDDCHCSIDSKPYTLNP